MEIKFTDNGKIAIEVSGGEAKVLIEELGDTPSKKRPKVRQLHLQLGRAIEVLPTIEAAQIARATGRKFF